MNQTLYTVNKIPAGKEMDPESGTPLTSLDELDATVKYSARIQRVTDRGVSSEHIQAVSPRVLEAYLGDDEVTAYICEIDDNSQRSFPLFLNHLGEEAAYADRNTNKAKKGDYFSRN